MSVLFDWYETPQSFNKPQEEKVFFPRVCLRRRCSTEDLCAHIESMTTAHRADIKLVLSALSDIVGRQLRDGCQVHLDGLGYFNLTLTTNEPVYASTKLKKMSVRVSGVKFQPDTELKQFIGDVEVERVKILHSEKLTEEETDERLAAHFARQPYLTRRELESLCRLTRSTANACLRQLMDRGKLLRRGLTYHPIYVPAPGHYGAAEETAETADGLR